MEGMVGLNQVNELQPQLLYRVDGEQARFATWGLTDGHEASAASTSPSSMRKPRILTWKSILPRHSINPSGRQRAKSP